MFLSEIENRHHASLIKYWAISEDTGLKTSFLVTRRFTLDDSY